MGYPLRYNTASQEVPLGYFLDSTDGNTEETGLTIANTDIKLHKAGATTLANKNSGGGTHISNGIYYATLDATDTNTLGAMVIFCHVSGALAVRLECEVLAQPVYDALYGSGNLPSDVLAISGDSTAADNLESYCDGTTPIPANATQISGDATAADNCEAAFDGTGYAGGTIKPKVDLETIKTQAVTCAAGVTVLASVGTALTSTAQTGDAFARLGAPVGASMSADVAAVKSDTAAVLADTGTDGVVVAAASKTGYALSAAGIQAIWDALTSALTTVGSIGKKLADWTILTAAAAADAVWDEAVADHSGAGSTGLALSSASAPTAAAVADAVWDEAISGHLGAGSTGAALNAAGSAGDPWSTAIPGSYGSGTAGKILGDNINATISSRSSHSAADVWAVGTRTLTSFGTLVSDIWANATRSLTDKAGFALSSAGVQAIWDALTSALTAVGSIGKKLADWTIGTTQTGDVGSLITTVGAAGAGLTSIPNPAGVTTLLSRVPDTISLAAINAEVDTALNTAIPGSPTANSINERVKAIDDKLPSGSIGDATAASQTTIAGYLDTEVAAILAAVDTEVAAIKAKTDNLPASPAAVGSQMDLVNAPNATAVTAIQAGLSTLTAAQVNSEVDTALADVNLDHLAGTATGIPSVPAGTFLDQIMDDGTATFDRTTDSLQALADSGGVGGGITVEQIADAVWDESASGHVSSGTFGKLLSFIKALL